MAAGSDTVSVVYDYRFCTDFSVSVLASPTDDDVLRFGEAVNKRRVTDYADPDSDFEGDDEDEDGNGEENQDEDGGLNGDTTLGSDMESDVEVKTDSTGEGHPMDLMDDGKSIMQIDPGA